MKTYIKSIYLPVLALASLAVTSCDLDEDNPSAGDSSLNSFQTWAGLQAYSYSTLNDQLYTASDWLFCSEGGTDLWQRAGNNTGYDADLNYENFGTGNNSTNKLWKQCYSMITNCNTVINQASAMPADNAEEVKILVAESKALRAFYNFLLVSNFGPVTLNLESSSALTGDVNLYPVRTSEKDFYEAIFTDLTEAAKDLGVQPYQSNRARVTKKTALGLLARAYAQRAGLTKYGDSDKYWRLAADTAEDLINNASSYGAHLYTDIADMWADANNRTNREALFIAAGGDPYTEAYTKTALNNKLLCYSCGGVYEDLYAHNPTKNGNCYFYGRYNNQVWQPSKYLMYCFNPEWDRRWEYSFIYAYSDYSMMQCGWVDYDKGQKEITANLSNDYAIDASHIGETINPYADCDGKPAGSNGNQYPAKIWPKDFAYNPPAKTGDKSIDDKALADYKAECITKLLNVAPSSSEIGQSGYAPTTKAYAVPYPVAADDHRFNTVFVHEKPSDADVKAAVYITVKLSDLYGPDGIVYGNTALGSAAANPPAIGNGKTKATACPSLSKFNWSYDGVFTSDLQKKTGDMYIMRMAEVYLIAAEAEQMLGNGQKAAGFLNTLRQRAVRPGAPESAWKLSTATEDDVLDEYAREMCGEFTRWALLKRHNAFETRLAKYNPRAAKSFKPYMYNRPISFDFLSTILNDNEYGDNGYGQTPTSGLENVDK